MVNVYKSRVKKSKLAYIYIYIYQRADVLALFQTFEQVTFYVINNNLFGNKTELIQVNALETIWCDGLNALFLCMIHAIELTDMVYLLLMVSVNKHSKCN
jgi:hypothetical protein